MAVYAGIVLSSAACLIATAAATACYVTLVGLPQAGWLGPSSPPDPDHVAIAAFNLLVVNVTGGLTALLALSGGVVATCGRPTASYRT